MSAIDYLFQNYSRHVRLPWSSNMAGAQRVWFAIYPPAEERRLRARLPQFETSTLEAGHTWHPVDFTKLMPEFLASHRYRDEIFKQPQHLRIGNAIERNACALIKDACSITESPASSVIALTGLASLFDLVRVSSLIEAVEDSVPGRLLVFFPGEYAGNIYRFMDARDGFNSARVDSERLERPHERLSSGEVHRSLCVSNARERERKEGWSHHAERVSEFVGKGSRPLLAERPIELGYSSGRDNTDTAVHRHLLRLESVGYAVSVWRAQSAVQYFLFIG